MEGMLFMNITYVQHTDVGEREDNEDSIGCFYDEKNGYCFIVADGLGGHGHGEEASKIVVDEFKKKFSEVKEKDKFFDEAFKSGQKALEELQDERHAIMELKTTAVALTIADEEAVWAHIGDSRLYVFNKNKVVKRTLDHSVPQMLVFAGEIKERHIRKHPDRNRLLKVLGARDVELKFDTAEPMKLDECQAFLLCSDGFWENITERKMCRYLKKSKDVNQWMELMKKEVIKKGMGDNMDNNSAIAVWIENEEN